MAKLMNPLLSSEARGRVGGLQVNTWRGIAFAKSNTSPAQPRSSIQLQIRAWTTYLTRKWATLEQSNRNNWNDYARDHPLIDWTGNPKRLTGLNWYVRCGVNLLRQNCALQSNPPTTAAPDAITNFAAANGVLQSVITWTAYPGTDKLVEIWMVGPHTQGRLAKIEQAKYKNVAAGEAATITITGLQVGRYTFFGRCLDEDNGLTSVWVSDTADITAA